MRPPYPQEIVDAVVKEYEEGAKTKDLSVKYGMHKTSIYHMVRRNGKKVLSFSESKRVYKIDEDYFVKIDSHSKAQILGFIFADGCLRKKTKDSGAIQVVLNPKDTDYLEWMRLEMKSERPLWFLKREGKGGKTRESAWFVTCHQKLVSDIQRLGVTERKSLTIKFPQEDQVPREFLWSFILGVFEGDGCIYLGKCRNGPTIKAGVSIAGSLPFNLSLQKFLKESHDIKSDILTRPTKQDLPISILRIDRVADIMRFYDLAYANASFKMSRKHEKFVEYRSKYIEAPAKDGEKPSYELIERKPFDDKMMAHLKKLARTNGMKTARSFYIKNPQGQIFHANAVKSFCKDLGLSSANLFRMLKSKQPQYKGWTIPTPEEIATAQASGSIIEKFY